MSSELSRESAPARLTDVDILAALDAVVDAGRRARGEVGAFATSRMIAAQLRDQGTHADARMIGARLNGMGRRRLVRKVGLYRSYKTRPPRRTGWGWVRGDG